MKANELEVLIRESVKHTLAEKHTKRIRGKKALKEGAEYSNGSLGADIELEPKVERAVMLAVHCAKVLTGGVARQPGDQGSTLEKCFDDIMGLFLDREGDFSVPDLNPDELKHEFATQLDHQMTNPESKVARVSRIILDKVVDKLNVFVGEAMIAEVAGSLEEAGYDQYGENMSDDMITEVLYEKHIGFQNLVKQLKGKGHSEESAKKIAYKIGVNKYGKKNMATAAKKHKPVSEKQALKKEELTESPPSGWHGTVAAMKQHGHTGKGPGKIDNPYALANYMANKGDEPHYKEQPSSMHGRPRKKKGQ